MPFISFIRGDILIKSDIKKLINDLTVIKSNSDISSTLIRNYIKWGCYKSLNKLQLLNKETIEYIETNKLYK